MTRFTSRLLRFGGPLALVTAVALTGAVVAQDGSAPGSDPTGLQAERERVQDEQARVAGEVDFLAASESEVAAALAVLDRALLEQQAIVVAAGQALVTARAELAEARRLEELADLEAVAAGARLHDLALAAYVRPPDEALIPALATGTVEEAPVRRVYAEVRAHQLQDAIDAIEATQRELVRRRRAHEAAEQGAAVAEADARARLADLESARAAQSDAFALVAERLEDALAESAALVILDEELAAQIALGQAELAAAAVEASRAAAAADLAQAAMAEAVAAAPAPADDGPGVEPLDAPSPAEAPAAPPAAPTPATPPPVRPSPIPVETTWVGGIEVAVEIVGQVGALLDAAAAEGLYLTGSGYRNIEDQIRIRTEVCGPTDYDIWEKPSWECSPPVARPGRSMHERGLAIDFTGPNGDLVRTRDSPTYQWLAVNAARFGLYNLPSEPWHWSTTGT